MPTTYGIEIQFIESSNGNPQQHAREHRIFVKNTQWEKPYIGMETVGEILVFILSNPTGWKLHDRISIYEWKMEVLKVIRVLVTFLFRPYIRLGILPIPIPPKKDLFIANKRVHLIKYWNFEILALDSNSSTSKLYTKWSF